MNTTSEKSVRLTAVYGRVSTAKQEEDGTIETQLTAVRDYAQQHGLSIVKEYIDDGWSGDVLMRPSLDAMRQDVSAKIWDCVLIYDPDRLARRYSYQELVMDELTEAGVEVKFVTIPAPKNPEEKILHGVRGIFAEYERTKIAERFRLGKQRKIKEGHIMVSQPLYGYDYTPRRGNEHGYYTINEKEAKVVRMIFDWVANDGLTIRQVVRKLQELGIQPRKSTRGVWSTSTLTTQLRNRAYIGEAHWRSSIAIVPQNPINKEKYRKLKKSSRKARPAEEWMTVPVPAIVDIAIFEKARERLTQHAALNKRNKKYEYLFGGLMQCSCGQKRIGAGRQHGKYLYYDCCDKILCFPLPKNCAERPINARVADDFGWSNLAKLMTSPELMLKQAKRTTDKRQARQGVQKGSAPELQKEIASLRQQEDRYNKAYGASLMSIEQLKAYVSPIRERIVGIERQLAAVHERSQLVDEPIIPTEEEITLTASIFEASLSGLNFEQKREIVLRTVETITGTQKQLEMRGFIPVSTTNGWYKTKDRDCRSAERGEVHAF